MKFKFKMKIWIKMIKINKLIIYNLLIIIAKIAKKIKIIIKLMMKI